MALSSFDSFDHFLPWRVGQLRASHSIMNRNVDDVSTNRDPSFDENITDTFFTF
jgi:hypothetical protein